MAEGGVYQRYVLTEKGRALFPLLVALRQWGEDYCFGPTEGHVVLIDKQDRLPVTRLTVHAHDGRILGPDETEVDRSILQREN